MSQTQTAFHSYSPYARLFVRMTIGAGIGMILISLFLITAGKAPVDVPNYWIIRPLAAMGFAGANAGVFYFLMDHFREQGGIKKILANIASLIVFILGMWLGAVAGLDGVFWN